MRKNRKLFVLILILGLVWPGPVWAGGGRKHFRRGQLLEAERKHALAAEAYLAALGKDPENLEYQIAYRRAATRASVQLVRQGKELLEQGQYEEAYNAFRRAYQFDKTNELARDLARRALGLYREAQGLSPIQIGATPYGAAGPRPAGTALAREGIRADRSGLQRPDGLPQAESRPSQNQVKKRIIFRNQDLQDVIRELARPLGLNVAFDRSVRSRKIDVDLSHIRLSEALDLILRSHQLFFVPINERTILIAQDTRSNRARLEPMSVQTFYLKNADPQMVQTHIQTLFQQRAMVVANAELRSLLVRATPQTLKVIERVIEALDKERPEVLIDISIYEVSRNDLREIGNQLLFDGFFGQNPPQGPIRPGSLNTLGMTAGQLITEQRLALAIPTTILRLLETRGRSRLIDSLQVHALDGQTVTANVGQRIPIQTASLPTSFTTLQQGQPNQDVQDRFINTFSLGVPQIEYQDVGLNITVTPTIYSDDDIKLEMEIETSGVLAGPTPLTPIFTRRRLKSVAIVKTGQAAMMAGVAQRRQSQNRTSLPFIGFLPIIGRFFSIPTQTRDATDLIITVTPHIIRSSQITSDDKLAMVFGSIQGEVTSIEAFLRERERRAVSEQIDPEGEQVGIRAEPVRPSVRPTSSPQPQSR